MQSSHDGFRVRHFRPRVVAVIACLTLAALPATLPAQYLYTPDSPEVREMVMRGVAFIETSQNKDIGPQSLHAIAICEASKRYFTKIPVDNELVVRAVRAAAAYTYNEKGEAHDNNTMYEPCVASILLGIVDPELYAPNLQAVLTLIENRQMPSGCWKYKVEAAPANVGDTSQTQYCCLATWFAAKSGLRVNPQMVERALDWLTQTQTSEGGWTYRASAGGGSRSGGETLSITAAGAGGVYMLLDAVNAKNVFGPRGARRAGPDLPTFVTEYDPEAAVAQGDAGPAQANINTAAVTACISSANQFFGRNFTPNPPQWTYYYLYGFERYAYFREQADGQVREIPDWYDQGVEFLKANQLANGSWSSTAEGEQSVLDSITTAFAVLFLVRSTELLANDPAKGPLFGGEAIPLGKTKQVGTTMVGEQITKDIDDFFAKLHEGDDNLEEFTDSLTTLVLPVDPEKREIHMAKLRVLVTDPDAYKRLIAVKAMATSRDMNNVPALLVAMNDSEPEIKKMAHQGLRFISRKMDSIKLPADPAEGDFLAARQQWVDWYKTVRPNDRQVID